MVFTVHDLSVRGQVRSAKRTALDTSRISRWRRLSLLALIVAIVHHEIHLSAGGESIAGVLGGSQTPVVPVPSLFTLWLPILLVLAGYAVFQLADDQRRISAYDRVSRHLAAVGALSSLLLFSIQIADLALAAPVAVALAAVAGHAYLRVHTEIGDHRAPRWLGVPIALLFGFTGIVAVGFVDAIMIAAGCPSSAPAISLMIGAGALAIHLGLHHRDLVLPGFVAWALTGICATDRAASNVASAALLVGAMCAAVAIVIAATRLDASRISTRTRDRRMVRAPGR